MSFNELGLSSPLLKVISEKGYTMPTPIQEKAIPEILKQKDILASAQTGTGKTAGFALPILQKLSAKEPSGNRQIRALVLTPTRELAAQVEQEITDYSKYLNIRSTVIFGGVNANPQIRTLKSGVDILIATPGRLLDLYQQKVFKLDQIEVLVLDEADRMLDMGFARDIQRILSLLPTKRQNLLFSATFSAEIKKLAAAFLHNPVQVEATPVNTTAVKIQQRIIKVDKAKKNDLVYDLIQAGDWKQVLIFTRTKHGANKLGKLLTKNGLQSAEIHGNKSQQARTKALAGFKDGSIRVLVATDIAARGLDIPALPHVINYELPNIPEDYVHRIGRTGRAGASGLAVSLVCAEEMTYLRSIEKLLNEDLKKVTVPNYEPTEDFRNTPPPVLSKSKFGNRRRNGDRRLAHG